MKKNEGLKLQLVRAKLSLVILSKYLFLVFGSIVCSTATAQWNRINIGSSKKLYSVNYYSPNDIWIGSGTQVIRTGNGGSTWTVIDPIKDIFTNPLYGNMDDLELTSPTSAVGVGFFNLGNTETILITTNNGNYWHVLTTTFSGSYPRTLNAIDRDGSVMIIVGSNGRIARSTDSGNTWVFVNSGTTKELTDVKFISSNVVVAVGKQESLRSNDAGLTWSRLYVAGDFNSVSSFQNQVYAGVDYSNTIFKSTNAGVNYSPISLPFSFDGIVFATGFDTILATGTDGLYKSVNGGSIWEKFDIPNFQKITMLDFINSNSGIAVGDSGFVIMTNNFNTIPTLPIPKFLVQGGPSFCLGDTITFSNLTAQLPAYSYSWAIDSVVFSTQINPNLAVNISGEHVISLTVSNGTGSSTYSQQISVSVHDPLSFSLQANPASNCTGNRAVFYIPNSQTGVNYILRNDTTPITNLIGNGSTLTLISNAGVSSVTRFNVLAIKNSSCFIDSNIVYSRISPIQSPVKSACIPAGVNSFGISNVSFNTINNTSPINSGVYSDYSCHQKTEIFGNIAYPISITSNVSGIRSVWIDLDTSGTFSLDERLLNTSSTTGLITIPSSFRNYDQPLRMRINIISLTNNTPCGSASQNSEYEDYAVTIRLAPSPPTSLFSHSQTTGCATTVSFTNSSSNSMNYLWVFGDGDTSTSVSPQHVYNNSGVYTVALISSNIHGNDTAFQTVTVQNPSAPIAPFCIPTHQTATCTRIGLTSLSVYGSTSQISIFSGNSNFQLDYTCSNKANLILDSTYALVYYLRQMGSNNCGGSSCAWIDWDNDGNFNETDERLFSSNLGGCPNTWLWFRVPLTAVLNTPLRARVISSYNYIPSSCATICGQYLDFTIVVNTYPPITPAFNVLPAPTCVPATLEFNNTSTNANSYFWDFGDGSTSTLANPTHTYAVPGLYSVKLVACNSSGGCDSLTRIDYFTVKPSPMATISSSGPISFCQGDSVVLSSAQGLSSRQWFRWNSPIPGATSQNYTARARGNYWYVGTNSFQCSDTSLVAEMTVPCLPVRQYHLREKAIDEEELIYTPIEEGINIFPNPGTGIFNLYSKKGKMEIFDFTGALIISKEIDDGQNEFDLSGYTDGIYFVIVKEEFSTYTKRIILAK